LGSGALGRIRLSVAANVAYARLSKRAIRLVWVVRFFSVVPSTGARLPKRDAIIAHEGKLRDGAFGAYNTVNRSATRGWRTMAPSPSRITATGEMGLRSYCVSAASHALAIGASSSGVAKLAPMPPVTSPSTTTGIAPCRSCAAA
jgi:hypothetical protein